MGTAETGIAVGDESHESVSVLSIIEIRVPGGDSEEFTPEVVASRAGTAMRWSRKSLTTALQSPRSDNKHA